MAIINIRLDPQSGPGHLQSMFPEITNQEAQDLFWRFKSIGNRAELVAEKDKPMYDIYLQWVTFKALTNG